MFAFLLGRGSSAGSAVGPGASDLGPVLEKIRAATGVPGLSAAVFRDGAITAQGVAGVRALGDTARVRIDDRFLIGSCAKSMLRVLIARLADQGVLSFATRLGDALPAMPMRAEYKSATLGEILSFRAGIPPYTEIGPKLTPWLFSLTGSPEEQRAAFAAHVLAEEPAAPPGSEETYSNAAYGIVAHVAESLAGKPWETLVAEQIFQPLGMESAIIGSPTSRENPAGPRGHFHTQGGYELTPGPRRPLAPIAPAGMVSCSVTDFARFAGQLALLQAGLPGDFLSKESAAALAALGPGDPKREGVVFLGGEGTFTAAYALWPGHHVAIVAETNGGDSDQVCQSIIDAVRAAVLPEIPASPAAPRRIGALFSAHGDEWEVADVLAGSPAARAGLAKGDRLVAINGVPLAKIPPDDRKAALAAERVKLTVRRGNENVECVISAAPEKGTPSSE